jgi:hypothetical protein
MVVYQLLGDFVFLLHVAYVGFVVLGLLLIFCGLMLRWRWTRGFWFRMIHILAIGIVYMEGAWGIECPLTILENALLLKSGQAGYAGEFVGDWLRAVVYFPAPHVFSIAYGIFGSLALISLLVTPLQLPWPRPAEKSLPRPRFASKESRTRQGIRQPATSS